jgi:hypothetical protein
MPVHWVEKPNQRVETVGQYVEIRKHRVEMLGQQVETIGKLEEIDKQQLFSR